MLFSQCFVWATDCYAIQFIISYDGANHAILCLQIHLMCWDVDIVHWNDDYIMGTDYWSHLNANLCFNLLLKTYLEFTWSLCLANPAQSLFPMKTKNMPYSRSRPHIIPSTHTADKSDAANCQAIVFMVMIDNCHSLCHLSNISVQFSNFGKVTLPNAQPLHNDKFPCYAQQVLHFSWAVYSFQGGNFCLNNPISKSAATHQFDMQPVQIWALTLPGVHITLSDIQ
jgi:hypothetical protein